MRTVEHFIDGKRVSDEDSRFAEITNPSLGEVIAKVSLASAQRTEMAITAASNAFSSWSKTPAGKRIKVMFAFRQALLRHTDELAELLSIEHGKTLSDSKGEIARGLEVVEFACGAPHLLKGEHSEQVAAGVDCFSVRQPLGVCAGITPFNFPVMVPLWMYPVAIVCGNTFVLKPSEKDPSAAVRIAEIFSECGLPNGVLNVINGDKEAVDLLLTDKRIEAVSFVGSTSIGQQIYSKGCASGKRVQALCGAKNHLVVMPDADMEQVVDALIGSAYGSAGERCMAISVAVAVGEDTADRLIAGLTPRIRSLKIAPYTSPDSDMGPIISSQSLERIHSYIEQGIKQGASLIVDGRDLKLAGHEKGFFLGGCLFDHVTTDMSIYQDEIFGPVLSVVRANSYDQATDMINQHEYGNGTAIFTRDGDAARNFAANVQVGMVGVNLPIPVPVAYHSFGGWKRSLFGDHHIHGIEGIRFYTRLKTMTTRWPSGIRSGADFHFKRGSDQ